MPSCETCVKVVRASAVGLMVGKKVSAEPSAPSRGTGNGQSYGVSEASEP